MKRFLYAWLILVSLACHPRLVQGQGVPMTFPPQFTNAAGTGPAALAYVCTFFGGTTTPLSTFSDTGLSTANPNPTRLNSAGRPAVSGSEVNLFMIPIRTYKINLYASGSGNTCNGTTVGTLIWSHDDVSTQSQPYTQVFALRLDNNGSPPESGVGFTYLYNNSSGTAKICQNGDTCVDLVGTGGGGTGTIGYLPAFTSSTVIGNSRLNEPTFGINHLNINEPVIINGTSSDALGFAGTISIGPIIAAYSTLNSPISMIYADTTRAWLNSTSSGGGTALPLALGVDSSEYVKITTEGFTQITKSYAGATRSESGTVALRNNAGALEASQDGGAWAPVAAGGTVTSSSSTAATLAMFSTATNVTDSMLDQIAGPFLQLTNSYAGGTKSSMGTVALRNNAGALEASQDGGAWAPVAAGGTVSGTTGTFAKFTGAAAVGDSSYLTEDTGLSTINATPSKFRIGDTSDDTGHGGLVLLDGLTIVNGPMDSSEFNIYTSGGGSGGVYLDVGHSGAGTTRPLWIRMDGTVVFKILTGTYGQTCIMSGLFGSLRKLVLSGSTWSDGGAC